MGEGAGMHTLGSHSKGHPQPSAIAEGDVMAENLLLCLSVLSEMERKIIADAMTDYHPEKPAIHQDSHEIGLSARHEVIVALRKFYRVWGTTAACDIMRKLQSKRCRSV
jgi:hypothetical protein